MRQKKMLFCCFVAIMFILSSCSKNAHQTEQGKRIIKIGYLPITHAAPLFMQDEMDLGNSYDIELIKFGSWPDLMDALNAGRIDGASVLIQLAMKAKEKGIDLKAVALGHRDGNVIVSAPSIDDAEGLKGESFAIPHTYSTHHLLLNELLISEGMEYDDVSIVELPPAEMPAALAEDRIAGYVVAEPFGALGVNMEIGKVLAFSDSVWPDSYCCVLVLRNDFIAENEDEATEFVSHYIKGGIVANEKGVDVYDALTQFMNVDEETLDLSLQWIDFASLRIEEDEYNKMRERVIRLNLMEDPPRYDDFVDNRFIDRANEG